MPDPAPWPAPEAAGLRSGAVLNFLRRVQVSGLELHGLNLWRYGRPVLAGHWWPYHAGTLHQLNSVSKSFVSAAVGLCIEDGHLKLETRLLELFPEYAAVAAPGVEALTLRHLLTMSSGHAAPVRSRLKFTPGPPWTETYLREPLAHPPGTHFLYDSADTFMLSAAVQRVTGQRVLDDLRPRLLAPLGIGEAAWITSPGGTDAGGWGLSLTTADLARFGELLRCGGMWQGQRLLPAGWLAEATRAQIQTGHSDPDWACGYGYQFWPCRHGAFRADGMYGQFVLVLPEQQAVLGITAGTHRMQDILNAVWDELLPGFQEGVLADDTQGVAALHSALSALRLPVPSCAQSPSEEQAQMPSRTFALPPTTRFFADDQVVPALTPGWTHFTVTWGEPITLTFLGPAGRQSLHAHPKTWEVQRTDLFADQRAVEVAAHAAPRPDGGFQFTLRLLPTLREGRVVVRPGEAAELYPPAPLEQASAPLIAPEIFPDKELHD
ncbi:serine hydrolase domain-containing protein [Deinococcus antarcticus]|uniref:Serine hydrolase domain-containing protein n=1 Tax=Deinococcus antarcticus TaxID=1298767 RepID=A0ABV8ACF8_9DEIO